MRVDITEVHWLDERHKLSLPELASLSGLSVSEVRDLIECGALEPVETTVSQPTFSAHCLVSARTAKRLRDDFELDVEGLALVLALLDQVRDLEAQLREVRAVTPRSHGD